ncbi:integrase core domain-containing protein [Candidatus Fukatsuia endosymbiont of Tuberolachnus salignus]|uniref:integrase core domain-containing protein n=1 Tax=Candidatus Fukatsuia endosymbiont of Tuberolachnus salignus TaxID=3077957 RepID=UPI00313EDFE1
MICRRFHKTMKNECCDVMFRRKIYSSLKDMQQDIDKWLLFYDRKRSHSEVL